MKKLLLLLCLLPVFMLCACGMNGSGSPGPAGSARLLGELNESAYTNNAIGFSAAVPEGWSVAGVVQLSRLSGGSVDYMNAATGLEPDSKMIIFFCSKYGLNYSGYNPGIGIEVSNQPSMMPLLTDEQALNDYIEQNREGLEQQYGDTEAKLTYETGVQIGGNEYSVIHISANYSGTQIMQDMYILGVNGYVMMITGTYSDEADKPAVKAFLESLTIEQKQ